MNKLNQILLKLTPSGRKHLQEHQIIVQEHQNIVEKHKTALEIINLVTDTQKEEDLRSKVQQIAVQSRQLTEQDIQSWRDAHATAMNVENPQRVLLNQVYHDVMLDDQITSAKAIRTEMLLKSKFVLVDKNGKEDTEKTELLNRSWFLDYLGHVMDARFWGHSLIQFTKMSEGLFTEVDIVPRDHVKPEKEIITKEPTDEKGFSYVEPPLSQYCVAVGKSNDYGLLLECCPVAIKKKYAYQFWSEFAEIFSVPIRVGKTNMNNTKEVSQMTEMLRDMGRTAYAILGNESSIEFVETTKQDAYMVYDKLIDRCDKALSKLILGQTMLMDDGSSRSQAEVHQNVAQMISDADRRFVMFHMNEALIPFLIMHGYPYNDLRFKWDDENELSFDQQLKVDQWLKENFEVDISYFKEKYNGKITAFKEHSTPIGGGEPAGK